MRANKIDLIAAAIFIGVGLTFALGAWFGLTMGRALRMGPGYFPFVLGLILVGLGVLVGLEAMRTRAGAGDTIAWRGLVLVTLAIVYFGLTVRSLGLVPSLSGAIVLAALATPGTTVLKIGRAHV